MRQAPAQPVELVNNQPFDSSGADVSHQPLQFGAAGLGPADSVHVEAEVLPAPLAAVPPEFLVLAVGSLFQRADPDVNGGVHNGVV